MPESYLDAVKQTGQTLNPLFNFLKITLLQAEDGQSELTLPMGPQLTQGVGRTAGGILSTLADEAMAHAAISTLLPDESCVTSEMNIRYLRGSSPATTAHLTAKASVLKRGGNIIFCTSEIYDDSQRLLATCGGTFYVLTPKKKQ